MKTNLVNGSMNINKIGSLNDGLFSCLKKGDKLTGIISEITNDKVKVDISNKSYLVSKDKFDEKELKVGSELQFEVVNSTKDKTELKKLDNGISNEDMLKSMTDGLVDAKSVFESYDFIETDDKEEVQDDEEKNTKSISKNIYEESIKKLLNHENFDIMKISTEEFIDMILDYNAKALSGLQTDNNLVSSIKEGKAEIDPEILDKVKNVLDKVESINNLDTKDVEEITLDFVKREDFLTLNKIFETQFKVCERSNNLDFDINNFEDNIKTVIENEGIEATADNIDAAKKLIANEIDVTKENLDRFNEIKNTITNLDKDNVIKKYIDLTNMDDTLDDVCLETEERVNNLEREIKESIDEVASKDEKLQMIFDANKGKLNTVTLIDVEDASIAPIQNVNVNVNLDETNKLRLELNELRLMFTAKSAYAIYSKGIDVELAPIKETLNELKQIDKQSEMKTKGELLNRTYEVLSDTKVRNFAIYKNVDEVTNSNLMQVAKLCKDRLETKVNDIAHENHIEYSHEQVAKGYDDNMITSRYTLKGEYNIANRNMRELLNATGIEDSDINMKCAIILSLSGKEVSEENINEIKNIETKLDFIVNNATPKVVKAFVDEGVDITTLNIDELENRIIAKQTELNEIDTRANINNKEKLVDSICDVLALENISVEVKDALLGIYKVLNKITKYGNAGAGILSHDDELNFTLREVFDATKVLERSRSGNAINKQIDDAFGTLDQVVENDNNAKKILDRSFAKIREEINKDTELISSEDVNKLINFAKNNEELLDKLYQDVDKITLEQIKIVSDFEDSKKLIKDTVLTSNLISNSEEIKEEAYKLSDSIKETRMKIKEEKVHIKSLKDMRDKDAGTILERFENETEGMEDTLDVTNRILASSENELMRIDAINKVLRLAYNGQDVSNANMQVPVIINDELTNINLIFDDEVRLDNTEVKMLLSMDLPNAGPVKADITLDEEKNLAAINLITTNKDTASMIMRNTSEIINMVQGIFQISQLSLNGKNLTNKLKESNNLYLRNKKIN